MLKKNWRIFSALERVLDNLIIIACFFASYYSRDAFLALTSAHALPFPQELKSLGPIEDYLVVLGVALPLYNAVLSMMGAYRSMRLSTVAEIFRMTVFSSAVVFLCEGSVLYLLKLDLSRSFVALFCGISGVLLFCERISILGILRYFRVRGKNFRNLLIVGTGAQARQVYLEIMKQPVLGIRVKGFVDVSADETAESLHINGNTVYSSAAGGSSSVVYDLPARIVATASSFETALKKLAIDEVLFTDVVGSYSTIESLAQNAAEEGIRVTLAADLFSLNIFKSDISYFGSIPLIHYEASPADGGALFLKRLLDIVVAFFGLIVLSPVLLLTALFIKLDSRGPVFFKQSRMGLNGRIFTLLKFRSMVEGAEERLPELLDQNEMTGPVFKMKNDPRVTRVGRFIRRYSIDELPQLINVLLGDMSLVGPRPPLPDEVSMYVRKHRRRLSMRPGLTCIWQISGRNQIPDFEEWAALDLQYIDNWSLRRDFQILLKTIPVVLSGSGAH